MGSKRRIKCSMEGRTAKNANITYNKYRNDHEHGMNDEDKEDLVDSLSSDRIEREQRKKESIREMQDIEEQVVRNSKSRISVSFSQIIITLLLMYIAYQFGAKYGATSNQQDIAQNITNQFEEDLVINADKNDL